MYMIKYHYFFLLSLCLIGGLRHPDTSDIIVKQIFFKQYFFEKIFVLSVGYDGFHFRMIFNRKPAVSNILH